jgi:predicted transcriptional regulator
LELRTLSKYLLTRKALSKFNRGSSIEITQQRLTVLLTLYTMQRRGERTHFKAIHLKLAALGAGILWPHLVRHHKQLMEAGLIDKDGAQFVLSPKGIATLMQINKILSRERFDR